MREPQHCHLRYASRPLPVTWPKGARLTGEPGVAIITAGSVTNVVTAVAGAYVDSVPMVVMADGI
jgi:hypothetical protein